MQVANLYGFSSLKKMASVLVTTQDGFRLYNKVRPSCWLQLGCCWDWMIRWGGCLMRILVAGPLWGLKQSSDAAGSQGAAEIVLARCTQVLDTNGVAVPLGADQRVELEATITQVRQHWSARNGPGTIDATCCINAVLKVIYLVTLPTRWACYSLEFAFVACSGHRRAVVGHAA